MNDEDISNQQGITEYQRQAPQYDTIVRRFDLFARFGFNIAAWRATAIDHLHLQPGDTVVDLGCGTGLNFPLLWHAIGPEGTIIGVDLSPAMLQQAQARVTANQWHNIRLVCADAGQFAFPQKIPAVLSTFTLVLVPNCGQVVRNACRSLSPGGNLVLLDMAWPRYCPLWWRHVLFFLRSYGVTAEVLQRKPWKTIQQAMEDHLSSLTRQSLWFGFFYLWTGSVTNSR